MKILKKTLLITGVTLLSLVLVILVAAGIIWMKPSVVINDKSLGYAQSWLKDNTAIDLTWEEFEVESSSPSFWQKRLALDAKKLCFNNPEFILQGCFEELALAIQINLKNFEFKIEALDRIIAKSKLLLINLQGDEVPQDIERQASAEEEEPATWEDIRASIDSILSTTRVGQVAVSLEQVQILMNAMDIGSKLTLQKKSNDRGEVVLALKLEEQTLRGELKQQATADLELSSTGGNLTGLWTLSGTLDFLMPGTVGVEGAVSFSERANRFFGYNLDVLTRLPNPVGAPKLIDLEASGETNIREIDGKLTVAVKNFLPQNTDILAEGCDYRGAIPYLTKRGDFMVNCVISMPVNIENKWTDRLAEAGKIKLPPHINLQVDADIETQLFADTGEPGVAKLKAELTPWREAYLGVEAAIDVTARGTSIMDFANLQLEPNVDMRVQVTEFEQLVKALSDSPFAIPAPLNVLRGKVSFVSKGELSSSKDRFELPLRLVTNLKSKEQMINTRTQGNISYLPNATGTKMRMSIDAIIDDFHLQLPDINPIAGIPALVPDSRIKSLKGIPLEDVLPEEPDAELEPPFLAYDVNIKTKTDDSVLLKSNLLKKGAPIAVNLKMSSDKGMRGYVNIHDAEVEYLRRTAKIQKLRLNWPDTKGAPQEIEGLISTNQQDVDVFIELSGTVSKPQFTMWSNPDLPPDSILALLLFNRPVDQLSAEENESAGNVANAIADGAIGIFGMWAFASTPVQSVSYDPETQVYSASVDVGGGASLTVGSNWDKTQTVKLRKRLAPNWVLTTSLEPNQVTDEDVGEMVLQWQNRY